MPLDSDFHGGSDGALEKAQSHVLDTDILDILDITNIFLDMKLPKTGPLSFESPCFNNARSGFVFKNGHELRKNYQFETPIFEGCGGTTPECAILHVHGQVEGLSN